MRLHVLRIHRHTALERGNLSRDTLALHRHAPINNRQFLACLGERLRERALLFDNIRITISSTCLHISCLLLKLGRESVHVFLRGPELRFK